jgi:hypothetical protein
MKIRCYMIQTNKEISVLNIAPYNPHFSFHNGIYTINKQAVSLSNIQDKNAEPVPELVYMEGNPLPLNIKAGSTSEFLEKIVIENALKQISKPTGGFMLVVLDYFKHPSKIMLLAFSFLVIGAILYAVISGGI